MARSVGAAEEGISVLLFNIGMRPGTIEPGGHMLGAIGQPSLWINQQGVMFCSKGHDDEFAKDPAHLCPVRSPKFYAFECHTERMTLW
jgi:hypothetical protein